MEVLKSTVSLDDNSIKRSAAIAKALGHPARIAILKLLAQRNTCFCGDITDVLPLAQSTVSQHLKALKSAGLITGEVEGVRTCYCLNPSGVKELKNLLSELSDELFNTCC
jgi:DNA-binding transcriptional ArsR family regulator